ncbi:MAG: Na/Pi cotransporter family protein [Bacteroidetes bacterium]|nr:Na/Pi cotransporter family protein [Bacteroidota bacterium]
MKELIFGILGGLGLFIFGMKYLSEGLQNIASSKIRKIMTKLTNNPFKGATLGAVVTSIVQSSSVTTVILIGLINAGIVNFVQGASVVLGANIGTTITAQMIAFKISKYAFPALGIGMVLMFTAKKEKLKFWGQIIFSLGIIFLGLQTMSAVVKPLKDVPAIVEFFLIFSKNPIMGILAGTFLTVLVQSSSASIGMLIALSTAGLIDFNAALYILLGDNIGTTITAWLASIGGTVSAKRLAGFHTLFNIIGTVYFSLLIYTGLYGRFIDFITPGAVAIDTIARHIANAHTSFNILNTLVFVPLIPFFVRLIEKIIPETTKSVYLSDNVKFLQENLIETPDLAIESARKEIHQMAKSSAQILGIAMEGFFNRDPKTIKKVHKFEENIDKFQYDITLYLSKISNERLSNKISSKLPSLIHTINDIERISDHAVGISNITERALKNNVKFSDTAITDLKSVSDILNQMAASSKKAIEFYDQKRIDQIMILEEKLNMLYADFIDKQTDRVMEGKCTTRASLLFIDLMHNMERIGDHLMNIAKAASYHFAYKE